MIVKTVEVKIEKTNQGLYVSNITDLVNKELKECGVTVGSVTVFVPASTAGVSTLEYEPNLIKDLDTMLERIIPSDINYEHHKTWGEQNGMSHLRASIFGPSLTIPFKDGRMMLGQYQHVVFLDFDVIARKREVIIQIVT
jgi:secondary thiamine-phosphate synthase enzyme